MIKIKIDGEQYEVPEGITLIQACDIAGIEIPRFCYHDRLSVAGNCRMCLVELENGPPKPIASCATQVSNGMSIKTKTDMVKNAREGVMEFLLANHPLDCPICDQGGECDLQDQALFYGKSEGNYAEAKRSLGQKNFGPFIKTEMTRCIHCMRCVRFATEVAGIEDLGSIGRGENVEVSTYVDKAVSSELSGNMIDLCPVGALTSKPNAFAARSWELKKTNSIDVHDAVGSAIRVDVRGMSVMRILPNINEDINEEWISDKARFSYDGLKLQRIDRPYIKKDGKLQESNWDEALNLLAQKIQKNKEEGKEFAALAGDLADVESGYIMKKLMNHLGSNNIDCRPEQSVMKYKYRSDYLFNSTISSIEESDFCLIIGSNPRSEASLVNARIKKRTTQSKDFKVALIGDEAQLGYNYQYLGNDLSLLKNILLGNHDISKKLKSSKYPMIIIGEACFVREDSEAILYNIKKIIEKYDVINNDWNGYNILHNAASRVGLMDIGFVPGDKGKDTSEIIQSVNRGSIGLVFLLGYDENNVDRLNNSFNVYIGSHGDIGAKYADIILPASAYTEKDAIYVNMEGRVQMTRQATSLLGQACYDWDVVNKIMSIIGAKSYKDKKTLLKDLEDEFEIFAANNIFNIVRDNNISDYKKSDIESHRGITSFIDNFYITNVINRASQNMIEATKEFYKKEN